MGLDLGEINLAGMGRGLSITISPGASGTGFPLMVSMWIVRRTGEPVRHIALCALAVAVICCLPLARAAAGRGNPYPNELPGFKLYEKYIAPLRPGVSVHKDVTARFGRDERIEVGNWSIAMFWQFEPATPLAKWADSVLAEVRVTSKIPIAMSHVQFSKGFTHGFGNVADGDSGCPCDVYSDQHHLSYWVTRGGQLEWISYGSAP